MERLRGGGSRLGGCHRGGCRGWRAVGAGWGWLGMVGGGMVKAGGGSTAWDMAEGLASWLSSECKASEQVGGQRLQLSRLMQRCDVGHRRRRVARACWSRAAGHFS